MEFLLTLGTLFWVIFAIFVIAFIAGVATESGASIASSIVIFILVLLIAGYWKSAVVPFFINIFTFLVNNPGTILLYSVAYIIPGIIYSFKRWQLKVRRYLIHTNGQFSHSLEASNHKALISLWIFYWPFHMFANFIKDPFKEVFLFIWGYISGFYTRIEKHERERYNNASQSSKK